MRLPPTLPHGSLRPHAAWTSGAASGRTLYARGAAFAIPALLVLASGCTMLPRDDLHGARHLEDGSLVVGAWLGAWPGDNDPRIDTFETAAKGRLDVVELRMDWRTPPADVATAIRHIQSRGAVAMLSWTPEGLTTPQLGDPAGASTVNLRDGRTMNVATYLQESTRVACAPVVKAGSLVLVRPMPSPNGDWSSWSLGYQDAAGTHPNDAASYGVAWQRLASAWRQACDGRALMVWSVHHHSADGQTFAAAYPGDAWVDFVGIDGHNLGSASPWGWSNFDGLFRPAYCGLTAVTAKPMLLTSVASVESGGDKAAWIRQLFAKMDQYRQMRGFVWAETVPGWQPVTMPDGTVDDGLNPGPVDANDPANAPGSGDGAAGADSGAPASGSGSSGGSGGGGSGGFDDRHGPQAALPGATAGADPSHAAKPSPFSITSTPRATTAFSLGLQAAQLRSSHAPMPSAPVQC